MTDYQEEQLKLRQMQIKYSSMYYTLPDTYQEKNKAYSDAFHAGEHFVVGYDTFIYKTHMLGGKISIGNNVLIENHCTIDYSGDLVIEDNVNICDGVIIYTHEHDIHEATYEHIRGNAVKRKVTIGENAWIGARTIILPGVTIGKNSVVGAGSVVTHDVPDACIYAGNPAKKIGENPI